MNADEIAEHVATLRRWSKNWRDDPKLSAAADALEALEKERDALRARLAVYEQSENGERYALFLGLQTQLAAVTKDRDELEKVSARQVSRMIEAEGIARDRCAQASELRAHVADLEAEIARFKETNRYHQGYAAGERDTLETMRERNANVSAFAEWALLQLEGDSGAGASYWEQFPEYVAYRAARKAAK